MDSGIYRLTYKNGATYVGKSKHLNTRWKQHFDKLLKGKAAKNMQDAYHASGNQLPKTEVLVYCHLDLLDYYEGYFINKLNPPLNTQIPDPLPAGAQAALVKHIDRNLTLYSVINMMDVLELYSNEVLELKETQEARNSEFEQLELDYQELDVAWCDRAVRDNWANREYQRAVTEAQELEAERDCLLHECEVLEARQLRVNRANWWQRLWRSW